MRVGNFLTKKLAVHKILRNPKIEVWVMQITTFPGIVAQRQTPEKGENEVILLLSD